MKLGFASADWARATIDPRTDRPSYGGSGWARVGIVARGLRELGLDVVEGTLAFDKKRGTFAVREWPPHSEPDAEAVLHEVDLIVLQRWMFASVAVETATARAKGQVVVNDLDDHFWALDPRNRAYASTDPKANPVENRDLYLKVIQASSAVTVSTPYLADELVRRGVTAPIHVLENHVDLDAFADVRSDRHSRSRPRIGWIGATPWRSGDVEQLRGVLGPFLARHDLRAYHGGDLEGAEPFAAQAGVPWTVVATRPMVPIHAYPTLFDGLDIGLVPLRDAPFNRAKSWIKGLEYAAAGVPFVAADLPEYRRLREVHGVGMTARRPRDWVARLGELLDPARQDEEREANLAGVKALDIRHGITHWRDLYLDLLANA